MDVGANIGTATLTAAAVVVEAGRVFAIEPHPGVFRYLETNVALNNFTNVELINVAAGEVRPTAYLSDRFADATNRVVSASWIKVRVERLDDLVPAEGSEVVALLKVDTEGYEKYVLGGATELLQRTQCVLFENMDENSADYGYSSHEVVTQLKGSGFAVPRMGRRRADLLAIRDVPRFLDRVANAELAEVTS